MDKRPVDIIEDDFSRVVGFELQGSFVGGKGELIICFRKIPPATWLIPSCSWG